MEFSLSIVKIPLFFQAALQKLILKVLGRLTKSVTLEL